MKCLGFIPFSLKVINQWGGKNLGFFFFQPALYLIALGHDAESWMCVFFELHDSSSYLYTAICMLFLRRYVFSL